MLENLDLEKAQSILIKKANFLGEVQKVEIIESSNRVLAEDIYSTINQPPFNRSPLDGYAFRAEDSKGAEKENPIELEVIDEVFAGSHSNKKVITKTAIRIMTGAPIPEGANCVVKQEIVKFKEGKIYIFNKFSPWDNVCFEGEDLRKGQLVLKKGTILRYGEIGVLASIGIKEVKVYKKPNISVLSTGDEVKDMGEKLTLGKIYNSNLYTISARLKELFCNPLMLGSVADNIEHMKEKIIKAVEMSNLVITTGGASVGEKDFIQEVIKEVGGKILFWKVKIKPGSAMVCSLINNKLVISLSGNPASAITAFELIVRPVLAKITGIKEIELKRQKGMLVDAFPKKSGVRRFIRGKMIYCNKQNKIQLTQTSQGNGILSSILNSNCLIDIKAGSRELKSGDNVEVIML